MLRIVDINDSRVAKFNARPAFPEEAEKAAAEVLAAIKAKGDSAVRKYVAKFEGFRGRGLRVEADLAKLEKSIDPRLVRAVKDAHRRVMRFSKASLREAWSIKTPKGGVEGEFFTPMDRVGV